MLPLAGAAIGGTARSNDGPSATPLSPGEAQGRILLGAAFLLGEPADATADSDFDTDGTLE
jgi:hypothetical protein